VAFAFALLAVGLALVVPAAASAAATATFTNPLDGAQNVDVSKPFTWTAADNPQAYYLYVGTSQGAKDLVDTGEIATTSYLVPALPSGKTLWARIWTKAGNQWAFQDVTFTAAQSTASFTNPLAGAQNVDTSKPFTWTTVTGSQAYYLYVGTTQGGKDLVDTGEIGSTSYQVPILPSGQTLWARIWTKLNNRWSYNDVSFTAAAGSARLTYPADGAQDVDPTQPFTWTSVPSAQAYYLYVGTTKGAKNVVDTGETKATSYQASSLPTGQTLYARIWTKVNGRWSSRDSTFTAGPSPRATFTYPTNGSTTVNTSKDFTWQPVAAAEAYYLYVGTSPGAKDLVDSYATTATSYKVPPLPVGQTLYARVWTQTGGQWAYYSDISFKVSISASRLTNPVDGASSVNTADPFTWSPAPSAEAYYLWLGSSPGTSDLFNSGSTTSTSINVPPLPVGQKVYARLYTKLNGNWNTYTESTFTAAYSAAKLTYPTANLLNTDPAKPFSWTAVSGCSGYKLWVGTSSGASDVLQSDLLTQNSYQPSDLPVGRTLWAQVWTLCNDVWVSSPAVPFSVAAAITAPAQRATNVDRTRPITWTPGATLNGRAPVYRLQLGSTPGAADLLDSGSISSTSLTPPASAMPEGQAIYARVIIKLGDGSQRRIDNVFTTSDTTLAPADLDWGAAGSSDFDASKPFAWSGSDLAQAYQLRVLDGSTVVADSGSIQVPRYFAQTLPLGSYTARLGTQVDGNWTWTTADFTVTDNGPDPANEIAAAHWATDYVRHMADTSNWSYGWTPLYKVVTRTGLMALCNNYAATLVDVLKQMNIAGQQSADHQPTSFDTAFIRNDYDVHTMVQFWNSADSDWIVLDPTFDLAMKRPDGHWATAADAQAATANKAWSTITYVPLGDFGTAIANSYYLDYPLLFLNIPPLPSLGSGADPSPYMTRLNTWPSGQFGHYILQSSDPSVTVVIDGQTRTMPTNAVGGYGVTFDASTVALPPGSTQSVSLYSVNRAVF
jgi:hypothetical protein